MNYKETLFFVGKCLTINHEEQNRIIVENELKSNTIDWDSVVKLSTEHYVFPALYCNLKKAGFLHYLPDDLVEYMKHITDLNRERNQQIITQAKEINILLLENNITPIFLKGTGNLLEGLYNDIAERMVGDIDFIVSEKEYFNTIEILLKAGYRNVSNKNYHFPHQRHYYRIKKNKRLAAVEIHNKVTKDKYDKFFDYNYILKDKLENENNENFLSDSNKLNLSIISKHINDYGRLFKNISLRNAYDVYLLSLRVDAKKATSNLKALSFHLNCFLASCHYTLGQVKSLEYNKNKRTHKYVKSFLNFSSKTKSYRNTLIHLYLYLKLRTSLFFRFFYKKEVRIWFLGIINDKDWQRKKIIQLGLKKPKSSS